MAALADDRRGARWHAPGRAYARVNADGTLDSGMSKNVIAVAHPFTNEWPWTVPSATMV
jgi:hypothetical protein